MPLLLERPRAFDPDVITEDGRIDAKKLAAAIDVPIGQLGLILDVKAKSLTDSPTSRKIQEPAARLVSMMNDLAEFLQEKRFARYWLRTPQPELGNYTALHWLSKGKLEEIADHVSRIVNHQPD
jgi:hypothetical protein